MQQRVELPEPERRVAERALSVSVRYIAELIKAPLQNHLEGQFPPTAAASPAQTAVSEPEKKPAPHLRSRIYPVNGHPLCGAQPWGPENQNKKIWPDWKQQHCTEEQFAQQPQITKNSTSKGVESQHLCMIIHSAGSIPDAKLLEKLPTMPSFQQNPTPAAYVERKRG